MNYLRKYVPSKIFDWCLNMLPVLYNRCPGTFPKFFKTFFFLLHCFHCTFFFFQALLGFLIFMKILNVPYFTFCTWPINDTIFKTLRMFCWPLVVKSLKKNPSQYCFYYMTWSLFHRAITFKDLLQELFGFYQLLGFSESNTVISMIKNCVVWSNENISQNPQWPTWRRDIHP